MDRSAPARFRALLEQVCSRNCCVIITPHPPHEGGGFRAPVYAIADETKDFEEHASTEFEQVVRRVNRAAAPQGGADMTGNGSVAPRETGAEQGRRVEREGNRLADLGEVVAAQDRLLRQQQARLSALCRRLTARRQAVNAIIARSRSRANGSPRPDGEAPQAEAPRADRAATLARAADACREAVEARDKSALLREESRRLRPT